MRSGLWESGVGVVVGGSGMVAEARRDKGIMGVEEVRRRAGRGGESTSIMGSIFSFL